MKFLANENFPFTSYKFLKSQGWDIEHIGSTKSGISDEEVMEISINEKRVIITFDSDYGELVYKKGYKPLGVLYLRIPDFSPDYPGKLLFELLSKDDFLVENHFTVISNDQIRQRKI